MDGLRVLESLDGALKEDSALLSADELQQIRDAQDSLRVAVEGNDEALIAAGIKLLDQVTQEFAARRMDNSIRRALTGHSVDEV